MPWTKPDPEWVPDEYPKALNKEVEDEDGVKHLVPVVYPRGHEKQGHPVVFASADEEKAYKE